MRSVVVVLPASICAMIPMLRVFPSMVSASVEAGLAAVAILIAFLMNPKYGAGGTDRSPAAGGSVALHDRADGCPATARSVRNARRRDLPRPSCACPRGA